MTLTKIGSVLAVFILTISITGCGNSKDLNGGTGVPPTLVLPRNEKVALDPHILQLKQEELKFTSQAQEVQMNVVQAPQMGPYLKLQKSFRLPIQFNGWIRIDHVTPTYQDCGVEAASEPQFTLLNSDDPNGVKEITAGERYQLALEKIYVIKVALDNSSGCKSINLQFVVYYGYNE